MAAYKPQLSVPVGSTYPPGNHPPPRSPSHTMSYSSAPYVPDEAILGTSMASTLPHAHRTHIHQKEGGYMQRTQTLSKHVMELNIESMASPGDFSTDKNEFFEVLYQGDEEKVKERGILERNRAKLTEYVHDCTVLFPYMREKLVFNINDCAKIQQEIYGNLRMNTFIDIVLTKGPQAIGVFHEALDGPYPAVFDVLSRLFTNAGISLPESRQLKDRPDPGDEDNPSISADDRDMQRSLSRRKGEGLKTIRVRLKDLSRHCKMVQDQRDELQTTLQLREKDIDALISRIDRQEHDIQIQQSTDLMSQLRNWREAFTNQSTGSIQQLGEIIQEKESIQKEYTELAGELELTVSELFAAKDRISKLLQHLERTDKQAAVAMENNDKLKEKIQFQEGELQKMDRKLERLKLDGHVSARRDNVPTDRRIQELETQLAKAKDECEEFQEQMSVASRERKCALEERDQAMSTLYLERSKNKKLKFKVKQLESSLTDACSQNSYPMTPVTPSEPIPGGVTLDVRNQVEDTTIFTSAEADSGLELGLAVVVRGVAENSKVIQDGVRVGDEIREVNRVKVTSENCKDPLEFARQIMSSVSQTVINLTIRRQTTPSLPHGGTPLVRGLGGNPLEAELRRYRKVSSQSDRPYKPNKLFTTQVSAKSSSASTSVKSHDTTSGDDTRESDSLSDQDDSEDFDRRDISGLDKHRGSKISDVSERGIVTSPLSSVCIDWNSLNRSGEHKGTVKGLEFGGSTNVSPSGFLHENSDPGYSSLPGPSSNFTESPRGLGRKRPVKRQTREKEREKMKLSKSLDDIETHVKRRGFRGLSPGYDLKSEIRRVVIHHGQWGEGFKIIGGRGNGIFVQSDCSIRGLYTGDQLLMIGEHSTKKLTYAEAMEMICGYSDSYDFMIVTDNKEGYNRLPESVRDNFYIRAKHFHHKTRNDYGMEFVRGDIFHVIDTKPQDHNGYWKVEKIKKTTGESTMGGYIPTTLETHEMLEATNSLPSRVGLFQNPRLKLSSTLTYKETSAKSAYEIYEPIRQVAVVMPRPLVLLGACEDEIRKGLVEQGIIQGSKFAFCAREPAEKFERGSCDKIVETVVTEGDVFKSTVDHVTRAANQGYHCVLCLRPNELLNPGVTSLHPIVILLTPRRSFRNFKDAPSAKEGRRQAVDSQYIAGLKRKFEEQITGEILLSSGMCFDDALRVVRETVAKQQKEIVWEDDL